MGADRHRISLRRAQLVAAAVGALGCGPKPRAQVCLSVQISPCRSSEHIANVNFAPDSAELLDPEDLAAAVRWAKADRDVRIKVHRTGDELHQARVRNIVRFLRDAGVIHEHILEIEADLKTSPNRILVVSSCHDPR